MTDVLAAPEFLLANEGAGPDPCSLSALSNRDVVVMVLLRDHHCTNCRVQVRRLGERYAEFRERAAAVAAVLPEPRERAAEWQAEYDLPFPLLADPDSTVGDAYDQPVQLGGLGEACDFLGRLPAALVLDARGGRARFAWARKGDAPDDRPSVDELLSKIDAIRE